MPYPLDRAGLSELRNILLRIADVEQYLVRVLAVFGAPVTRRLGVRLMVNGWPTSLIVPSAEESTSCAAQSG
jgi:hypothetical protein